MNRITKPTWNEEYRVFEFKRPDGKGQLNDTETLTTAAVVCTELVGGTDASATMIAEVAVYNSTAVKYKLKGGTKGVVYHLEFQVVTSTAQKLSDTLIVEVV